MPEKISKGKAWLTAARLRTLPLSLSSIGMGTFLAAAEGKFNVSIFLLAVLTTISLQVLSNFANDYGDSKHGADHSGRKGPSRMVQSGAITSNVMRKAMILMVLISLLSGLFLLYVSLGIGSSLWIFLGIGILAIIAAITYTAGFRPYGYMGLGDISVILFFGIAGVMGSYYLYTQTVNPEIILPSLSCGFLAAGVLNLNNIRDIESDKTAGKNSIPVRIGKRNAVIYHWSLLGVAFISSLIYVFINYSEPAQFLFILVLPLLLINGLAVYRKKTSAELDPFLKQLALSTLLFVILFGVGQIL
jgi:1,4-dihydroxy-2-naphthoate polyprenyltransferase